MHKPYLRMLDIHFDQCIRCQNGRRCWCCTVTENSKTVQGKLTDQRALAEIRSAISDGHECTVRLLNYKKDGTPFWNMLSLAPMLDVDSTVCFYIGVQVDVTAKSTEPTADGLPQVNEAASKQALDTSNIQTAVTHLGNKPVDGKDPFLVIPHSKLRVKPHSCMDRAWHALNKLQQDGGTIELKHFRRVQQLGSGDVGLVDLVRVQGSDVTVAMKTVDKLEILERNKLHRLITEEGILGLCDHPFLATLYCTIQSEHYLHFVMEYCSGGELYKLLYAQKGNRFEEKDAQFYASEVLVSLQYLHVLGCVYRDLKPENILIMGDGHARLTDFDLCVLNSEFQPEMVTAPAELLAAGGNQSRALATRPHRQGVQKCYQTKGVQLAAGLVLSGEPQMRTNSFVGTEEYLSPEVIQGNSHGSAVDWWSLGILIYELTYGTTPFKGQRRSETFSNIVKVCASSLHFGGGCSARLLDGCRYQRVSHFVQPATLPPTAAQGHSIRSCFLCTLWFAFRLHDGGSLALLLYVACHPIALGCGASQPCEHCVDCTCVGAVRHCMPCCLCPMLHFSATTWSLCRMMSHSQTSLLLAPTARTSSRSF
jgi:phototropin